MATRDAGRMMGLCIFPCHPCVSWSRLSVSGFVHISPVHVLLRPGCAYGSDSFCSSRARLEHEDSSKRRGGVQICSSVLQDLDIPLAFWVSKLNCWLHPWKVSADSMKWFPINALGVIFYPSNRSPHRLFLVLSNLFFLPSTRCNLSYALTRLKTKCLLQVCTTRTGSNLFPSLGHHRPTGHASVHSVSPSLCSGWHNSPL